jgi:hypothetical protein
MTCLSHEAGREISVSEFAGVVVAAFEKKTMQAG